MSWNIARKFIIRNKIILLSLFFLLPIYYVLYQIYIPRVNAFGCFDDCNNFMRGYFFLHGNPLFSHVFSGHQPFGSYISALVQFVTTPENIYELVLRHRQFIMAFGLVSNILLILRFGPKILIFTVIFEFSKFYIFGDRFLGESMVVYPAIYLTGLVFLKLLNKKINKFDYIITAVLCWFIVFLRITYVPMVLFLLLFIFWEWPIKKIPGVKIISIALFIILSLITVLFHDIPEYFFNVVVFNYQVNLPAEGRLEMFGPKILHWFFYPIYIFFYGPVNIFKTLLIGINIVFIFLFAKLIYRRKFILAIFIFILLGAANIRTAIPGNLFLGSFHMVPWFGVFIFTTVFLLFEELKNKRIFFLGLAIILGGFLVMIISPEYFAKKEIDTHKEFIDNYGYILQQGEVIKILSDKNDTLFLDASDDLIYWQSGLFSPYRYSWYTSSMPAFEKYSNERMSMFRNNPPDFYREYGRCPKKDGEIASYFLPEFIRDSYVRLYENGEESCIYVHKDKLVEISEEKRAKAGEWLYTIPDEKN